MIYYKITNGYTESWSSLSLEETVQYQTKIFVYPKIQYSKLFVFDSLDQARKLALNSLLNDKIWKCEVQNPKKLFRVCLRTGDIRTFWRQKHQKKKVTVRTCAAPKGTIVVNSVKLTERVI